MRIAVVVTIGDALISVATALVYPSLVEGFGLPVLEAMASAGRPAGRGLLVDPLDVAAIGDALVSVRDDPERWARLGDWRTGRDG